MQRGIIKLKNWISNFHAGNKNKAFCKAQHSPQVYLISCISHDTWNKEEITNPSKKAWGEESPPLSCATKERVQERKHK